VCMTTRVIGVSRPGPDSDYISVPVTNVWQHDSGIDRDVASIFDPFGNAVHTALSFPVLGEDVLVTGAGPIGIMAVAVAKHAGARFVVVTDLNDYRLDLAKKMGATVALNIRRGSLAEVQKQLGMKEGFDVGLEMSGSPAAFRDMIDNMCHGGKIAMLGIPTQEMAIDWRKLVFNMLTIKGIYGREMYETWYKMSVMLETGLDITPVITHRYDCTDFEKGFEAMLSGKSGKVILNWR
jgi:threonine 3-dehydrogenase